MTPTRSELVDQHPVAHLQGVLHRADGTKNAWTTKARTSRRDDQGACPPRRPARGCQCLAATARAPVGRRGRRLVGGGASTAPCAIGRGVARQPSSGESLTGGLGVAGRGGSVRRRGLALLLDLGLLAAQVAQVVQLGAAHVTAGHDLDLLDDRGVHREGALDADAEADLADGEGLAEAAALAADDDALEDLDARAVCPRRPGRAPSGCRRGGSRARRRAATRRRGCRGCSCWVASSSVPRGHHGADCGGHRCRSDRRSPGQGAASDATVSLPRATVHDDATSAAGRDASPTGRPVGSQRSVQCEQVRPAAACARSAASRRQRAISPWWPDSSTAGTSRPAPAAPAWCRPGASSRPSARRERVVLGRLAALPSTPGSSRATASTIDQHRHLAAGQHVVAEADLVDRIRSAGVVEHPRVDALVAAAGEHQPRLARRARAAIAWVNGAPAGVGTISRGCAGAGAGGDLVQRLRPTARAASPCPARRRTGVSSTVRCTSSVQSRRSWTRDVEQAALERLAEQRQVAAARGSRGRS